MRLPPQSSANSVRSANTTRPQTHQQGWCVCNANSPTGEHSADTASTAIAIPIPLTNRGTITRTHSTTSMCARCTSRLFLWTAIERWRKTMCFAINSQLDTNIPAAPPTPTFKMSTLIPSYLTGIPSRQRQLSRVLPFRASMGKPL